MADWRAFYARFDAAHRELISALVHDWQQTGQIAELAEGDAVLLLRARSALGGNPVFAELRLDARRRAQLRIAVGRWRRMLGEDEAERLLAPLTRVEELAWVEEGEHWRIDRPAHLSPPQQKALRDALVAIAHRLFEVAPS